jgi:hypothetical protein
MLAFLDRLLWRFRWYRRYWMRTHKRIIVTPMQIALLTEKLREEEWL